MENELSNPAQFLEGKLLDDTWLVKERKTKNSSATGGNFSCSYIVENQTTGQQAFLKALDFSRALSSEYPVKAMTILTSLVNYEQNLLEICRSKKLSRIVSLIDSGNLPAAEGGIIPVPYFILELATGDIYDQIDFSKKIDFLLNLKILHSISAALSQLHYNGIAHQDLKPSNVLIVNSVRHKLGDLGRADLRTQPPPYSVMPFAGDPSYAPPEALYNSVHSDWVFRRIASDAYQLGSMIVFLFTKLNMTAVIKQYIAPQHDWNTWTQTYREVIPYLYVALEKSVDFFKEQLDDNELAEELSEIIYQLCDPDPTKRGHPQSFNKRLSTLSLQRYTTIFDRLMKKYEVKNFITKK